MPKKTAVSVTPEPAEEAGEPIIVRRAMMKDDSVSPKTVDAESVDAANPIEVKSKKSRIEPLTPITLETDSKETATAAPVPNLPTSSADSPKAPEAAAVADKPVEDTKPQPQPATTVASPPADSAKIADTANEFTLAGADSMETPDDPSQNPIDQAKAKADKEAADKQAALDKLIDAQTYFLPINSIEKRRTKQLFFVTLLLLIVLAAAAAFWANGQGIISIPGL